MKSLLTSNEPAYIRHYNSIFEELWKNGVDAIQRIKDIEAGDDLADIEVISSSARTQELFLDILKSTSEEILWIFPSTNAFIRQEKIGAIQLAEEAAKQRNVKVRIMIPENNLIEQKVQPQDVFVYADKGRISQVILNLLDNAVKFTKNKECTITVIVEKKEDIVDDDDGGGSDGDEQQCNDNNQEIIIISIKDTGKGIDPQIFPRLFTKFATKSETGTGLGLFICKGIVEAHGGKIRAENNPDGKGATFAFSLPLVNK